MMLHIPQNDHGAIYVLELTGPPPAGLAEKSDAAMIAILGPVVVNTDYVDAITPDMLTDMTLPQLITNGYDMPVDDDIANTLDRLTGTVVLIMSAAFGGQQADLDLPDGVRLVTTLREVPAIKITDPLTTASTEGSLDAKPAKPPKSNARMSGMVATYALLAMFALVGLMIWVGG